MQPRASPIDRHPERFPIRPRASADTAARFQHAHGEAGATELASRREPGRACSDDKNVQHGGPDMAPKPPTLGAPRETRVTPRSRGTPRYADKLLSLISSLTPSDCASTRRTRR